MFYLLILLLQMKLIKQITDLNKAINIEKRLGFVPTMGSLHKGHEALIKESQKKCKKTIVTIFVNPTQFNNKNDYKNYPQDLNKDLKILKKLKVDYVYLPTVDEVFKERLPKILLNKSQKILCARFRKGHFEGVLDILNRFAKLISPKSIFMGEKDFQQFFLVKNFIEKKYKTKVYVCKTIRDSKMIALSSRNNLLNKNGHNTLGLISNELVNLKKIIYKNRKQSKKIISIIKKDLVQKFKVKIEYLECRNTINLSTNIQKRSFKLFVAFYLNNVRLIDNF
ncbi:pantoate--beta-alanine ligase [Candidatus Pelagibacter sp. Uisw_113]|uniref:pantoate--beta-alanine ligase n=1 Tax=Candidatus Pelagibacter sp. Uisw_113 TaxID=3230994 RepID=UPI0039E7C81F